MDGVPIGYGLTPEDAITSLHASLLYHYGVGLVCGAHNRYWYTDNKGRKWMAVYVPNNHVFKAYIDRSKHFH